MKQDIKYSEDAVIRKLADVEHTYELHIPIERYGTNNMKHQITTTELIAWAVDKEDADANDLANPTQQQLDELLPRYTSWLVKSGTWKEGEVGGKKTIPAKYKIIEDANNDQWDLQVQDETIEEFAKRICNWEKI